MIANRFGVGGLIGQGSMGEVYRGLDTQTDELIAIKALKQALVRSDSDIAERFAREGEALRRLNHPNIVKVLASVVEASQHYIVMEYVGGGSLDKLIRREKQLPIERVLKIGLELSDALVRAHHLSIIHRDIKPQNVLLAEDGTPRLTDFGVAHMSDLSSITQAGALIGTMPYLSPEAWQFEEPDDRTDIWAFGVMLYELLAGRRPFSGDTPSKLKQAILQHAVPDLRQFCPRVPPQLAELIDRMLDKDRARRIASMRRVGAELEAIARGGQHGFVELELAVAQASHALPEPAPASVAPEVAVSFDLTIAGTASGYAVVLRSDNERVGARSQPFILPFDPALLGRRRREVADWVKQARIRRLRVNEELRQAREFGGVLFDGLFRGEVLKSFRARRAALPPGERLRLRLRLPPDLGLLPWELLYDTQEEQFLALAPDLALQRYPQLPAQVEALRVDGPLRVVAVLASPEGADYPPIKLDRELRRIESVLKGPIEQGRIALDVIRGPGTLDQLRARLRDPVHVLHVLCHGDLDETRGGLLIFEDSDGAAEPVGAELLRVLVQRRPPRLVLLNACLGALSGSDDPFSSVGTALLRGGVPAVIAMQFELAEDAAVELARVFYAELAAATPVELALAEARQHLYGRYTTRLDWAIPVLFMRAASGALFEMTQTPPPTPMPEVWPPRVPGLPWRAQLTEQQALQRLWHRAQAAYVTRDWERAAQLLEQVAEIEPTYENVQEQLAEARRQLTLHPLYRQALALRDDSDWQAALDTLDELARQQPDHPDADGVRAWAEQHRRREQLYAAALVARERADWAGAMVALETLLAETPEDTQARSLLAHVSAEYEALQARDRQHEAEERQRQPGQGMRRLRDAARDPRARFGPPLHYVENGDFDTALDLLHDILTRQPANRAAADLTTSLIERADVPLPARLRAARLAERIGDIRLGVCGLEPVWCSFRSGKYLVGGQPDPFNTTVSAPQRIWLDTFQIARYPVTVRQFLRFWEDREGYANRRWWTLQGWAWKQEQAVTKPYRWGDRDWMALNQPVAGVSWYEAAAFCAWLTQRRREAAWLRQWQVIRLPSEAEWEVAATWDPRSRQPRPWRPPAGAIWQNVVEAGIGRASPVGIFPEGASPSGVLDMAGNVWEWCSSRFADYPQDSGQARADFALNDSAPAVRGGAYNIQNTLSGWGARTWYFPYLHQYNFMGFRVVLASKKKLP
jgi:formylglycine-generating enzyme required for sulfatase activity/tetratricopeptide (TPR) repeat protein/predicted Ser/Thr protein kinase